MTLIRSPFKKRVTIIADDSAKPSPQDTPKSLRSNKSSSVLSSVNSLNIEDSDENKHVVGCATNNIYADIDESCCTNQMCEKHFQIPIISECESFEECVEEVFEEVNDIGSFSHSKNNLFHISDQSFKVKSSIDCHLDQIDSINRNLDKMLKYHHDAINQNQDVPLQTKKIHFKEKFAEKYRNFMDLKLIGHENQKGPEEKETLASRIKLKFTKQSSIADEQVEDVIKERGKNIFASFRGKKPLNDPQEEYFEQIFSDPISTTSIPIQVTDLDTNDEACSATMESGPENTFKQNFKKKIRFLKLPKSLTKRFRGKDINICPKCSKQLHLLHESKALLDFTTEFQTDLLFNENNDFCVCVDDDDALWFKSGGNVSQKNVRIKLTIYQLIVFRFKLKLELGQVKHNKLKFITNLFCYT